MKSKGRGGRRITLVILAVLALGLVIMVYFNLPKPLETSDNRYDLSLLSDGVYIGNCDNGLVKVKVEVEVRNHEIYAVRIIEHQHGQGAAAEEIVDDVVLRQSVEIDAVAGATASSQTILKAIENALSEGVKNAK